MRVGLEPQRAREPRPVLGHEGGVVLDGMIDVGDRGGIESAIISWAAIAVLAWSSATSRRISRSRADAVIRHAPIDAPEPTAGAH